MNTAHVGSSSAAAYALDRLTERECWELESHVETCTRCARTVSKACSNPALREVRLQVLTTTAPSSRHPLRLTLAPALRTGWLLALLGVVLAVLALDELEATRVPVLLLVAPLVPLLGVTASCSAALDGTAELTASTPTPALRLLLLRAASVLVLSVPPLLATSLLTQTRAVLWLLPAAALVALALALSAWVRVELATALASAVWSVVALGPGVLSPSTPTALTTAAAPVWVCLAVGATVLLVVRRAVPAYPGALP